MLDPFAQLFQHCWGHTRALHMVSKVLLYPCHDALQVPTLLGVGAPLPTLMLQIPTLSLLTQQCLELLGPFVLSLMLRGNGRNIISQQLWMLHVASCCTPCCMLLLVVGSCWAKFETGQTFSYVQTDVTTPKNVESCWPTMSHQFARG